MRRVFSLPPLLARVLPLLALSAAAHLTLPDAAAAGGSCWASADTRVISVTTGGTQTIAVRTQGLPPVGRGYRVLGSFAGTSPGTPFFSTFVPLNPDRYFVRTYSVGSRFLPGDSHLGALDANGNGVIRVVVPPNAPNGLIGRTLHHVVVPQQLLVQQPYCSTQDIGMTFAPRGGAGD